MALILFYKLSFGVAWGGSQKLSRIVTTPCWASRWNWLLNIYPCILGAVSIELQFRIFVRKTKWFEDKAVCDEWKAFYLASESLTTAVQFTLRLSFHRLAVYLQVPKGQRVSFSREPLRQYWHNEMACPKIRKSKQYSITLEHIQPLSSVSLIVDPGTGTWVV